MKTPTLARLGGALESLRGIGPSVAKRWPPRHQPVRGQASPSGFTAFILPIAFGLLLSACNRGTLPLAPSGQPGSGTGGQTGGAKPVTFSVKVDPAAFSDKRQITISVWDAEQLKVAEETSGCSVSMNAQTGQETVSCPPGVTYRKPTPEETIVSKADLAKGVTIVSKTVTTGERYRVSVGGMAADDCNSASGSAEGTAGTERLSLNITEIAQTMMACVPTRGR